MKSVVKLQTSLRFLQWEMAISGMIFSMPIMVPFYHSIGMDQASIGLSQTIFSLAIIILNIPTGWIADRFSHKMSNAIGDFGCAIALALYSMTTNFAQVVWCEILFGLALCLTNGADGALVKSHTYQLDPTGKLFHKVNSLKAIWAPTTSAIGYILGSIIGANSHRLAILLSSIPLAIGGLLSLMVRDEGLRLVSQHKNPIRDIWRVTRQTVLPSPKIRWLIFANGIGKGITHVMIWALTPLALKAGIPMAIVGISWILNSLASVGGATLAKRLALKLPVWQRFLAPIIATCLALITMTLHLSYATIWLYAILGATFGWYNAILMPLIQKEAPDDNQASAISIADTFSRLLYAPSVWLVGKAGVVNISMSMVATIAIFLPPAILIAGRLKSLFKNDCL